MLSHVRTEEDVAPAPPPGAADEALDALGVCWALFDRSGVLVWRSETFAARLPELTPGGTAGEAVAGLAEALTAVAAERSGVRRHALATRRRDRRVYDVELVRRGERIYVAVEDAAERQEAQARTLADRERLLLTSRVLSVGEMASMLAHELNQPIGSISNLIRGLQARQKRGALDADTTAQALTKASEQALYAAGVIGRIRAFVKSRQPNVAPLDTARLARCTLDLLDWEITRDKVETLVLAPPGVPCALGDEVMIQQVLVNLARNALDAMRAGAAERRLTLASRAAEDGRVELTIADSGPGMSDEVAARLFQPFHSTKPDGMGVGLGLCRSIVELHGGRLWFTRNEDAPGCTFHVVLPAAPEAAA